MAAVLAKELSPTDQDTQLTPTPALLPNPPGKDFCFLFPLCRTNPGQGILPSPSALPSPSQGGQEESSELLPVLQDKLKEARTRLKSRAACGAEVRYPGLQRETPICTMLVQGCLGVGTMCPECAVSEVSPVLLELGTCSVFGGKERRWSQGDCPPHLLCLCNCCWGGRKQSLPSFPETRLLPLRKGDSLWVPWIWGGYRFTCRHSVDSLIN